MSTLDPVLDDPPDDEEIAAALSKAAGIDLEEALDVIVALQGGEKEAPVIRFEDSFSRQLRRRLHLAYLRSSSE